MAPKNAKTVDPRSLMTDRDKFLTRSLHTPSTVAAFAAYIAEHETVSGPKDAVRKALKLLGKPNDYDPAIDPTVEKAIELTRKAMGK
jgi:hypothetical protein